MAHDNRQMTMEQFKSARLALGYSQTDMARVLDVHRRTVQDWESGTNRVPGLARVAVELLLQKDKWVMQAITAKINRDLDARYPRGFVSYPDPAFMEGV